MTNLLKRPSIVLIAALSLPAMAQAKSHTHTIAGFIPNSQELVGDANACFGDLFANNPEDNTAYAEFHKVAPGVECGLLPSISREGMDAQISITRSEHGKVTHLVLEVCRTEGGDVRTILSIGNNPTPQSSNDRITGYKTSADFMNDPANKPLQGVFDILKKETLATRPQVAHTI